jgi:hypothetical protein
MTIFAILMPSPQPKLAEMIKDKYPNDHLMVTDTQWLISSLGTVVDITEKLEIHSSKPLDHPSSGNAIVFATSSYFGRAPMPIWDWMKVKLEA